MSNHLAIATVTATLQRMLQTAVGTDVPGAEVRAGRPDATATPPVRVSLFLYQVVSNAAWHNRDLPTRDPDGRLIERPLAALDLHYLLSFYGSELTLEPQRMLGSAVRALHARPLLTRQMIKDALGDAALNFLAGSDLADQIELVKFTPLPLSLDELSKLWSVFFQVPYALSIAYQGTVVLIEAKESPRPALPVRRRGLYVAPFRQPVIDEVVSEAGAGQPILAGAKAIITGTQLRGGITRVRIGGVEVEPPEVSDSRIALTLPAGLRAGVQGIQVVHRIMLGEPATPHRGVESNVAPFVLCPSITTVNVSDPKGAGSEPRSAKITVQLNPEVGKAQRLVLLLNQLAAVAPAAYSFVSASRNADADSIVMPVEGLRAGSYLVRVQVDGAESPLTVDTDPNSPSFNQYIGPQAVIP